MLKMLIMIMNRTFVALNTTDRMKKLWINCMVEFSIPYISPLIKSTQRSE